MMILGRLLDIAIRDLGAKKTRDDETYDRNYCEYDYMLITSPSKREMGLHQSEESVNGECSKNEE